jgi:hypothetical protein
MTTRLAHPRDWIEIPYDFSWDFSMRCLTPTQRAAMESCIADCERGETQAHQMITMKPDRFEHIAQEHANGVARLLDGLVEEAKKDGHWIQRCMCGQFFFKAHDHYDTGVCPECQEAEDDE